MQMNRLSPLRLGLFVATAVIYGGILVGSLSSQIGPPNLFPYSDKLVHMSAWGLLAGIAALAVRGRPIPLAIAVALLASSATVEWGQAYIPGRSASYGDLLANALGIGLGTLLSLSLSPRLLCAMKRGAAGLTGEATEKGGEKTGVANPIAATSRLS